MDAPRVLRGLRGRDLRRRLPLLQPLERRLRGSAIGGADQWALDLAQSVHAPWLDVAGSLIGLFGQAEITGGIALGIAVARWWRRRDDWWVPLAIALTVLVEALLKIAIPHAPPPHERSRSVELLPLLAVPFANSFPSGHVARAAFLLRIGRRVPAWLVALGIVLMAASRIYLGEHWLSDTIGGAALGLAVAEIARRLAVATSRARART